MHEGVTMVAYVRLKYRYYAFINLPEEFPLVTQNLQTCHGGLLVAAGIKAASNSEYIDYLDNG